MTEGAERPLDVVWRGCGPRARLYLLYARRIPDHPSKIRIAHALSKLLFPKGMPLECRLGARVKAVPWEVIGHAMCFGGSFEPRSLGLAVHLMKSGGVFLDIGSNFGLYTFTVGALRNTRCIAVDASAEAFTQLKSNAALNPGTSVLMVNVALASSRNVVELETPAENNLGTTQIVLKPRHTQQQRHLVASIPLDELLTQLGSPSPITLMKIDVEGAELDVFRGFDFSGPLRPQNIIMEYEPVLSNAARLEACRNLLTSSSYSCYTIEGAPFEFDRTPPESNLWWRSD